MKKKKFAICFMATMLVILFAFAVKVFSADKEKILPSVVGIYEIHNQVRNEAGQMTSIHERATYLSSVIASNTNNSSTIENFKKASAIRLLGVIGLTNSIGILITNIDFEDIKYHNYPAVASLIKIGEPAVPQLLDVVKEPLDKRQRVPLAVEALLKIKGKTYEKFVQLQKNKMPSEVWSRLLKYAIDE